MDIDQEEPMETRYDVPLLWDQVPSEMREKAYRTLTGRLDRSEALIFWENKPITVDAANDLWMKYSAEGNEKAALLSGMIASAKAYIRELYPDEEV